MVRTDDVGAESPHPLIDGRHSRQRPQGFQAVSRLSEVVSRRLGGTSRETQTEIACLRTVFLLPGHILSDRGEEIHGVVGAGDCNLECWRVVI